MSRPLTAILRTTVHGATHRYRRATSKQKVLFFVFCALNVVLLATIIIITPHGIALYMQRFAEAIRDMHGWGAALLFLMVGNPRKSPSAVWIRIQHELDRVYVWILARRRVGRRGEYDGRGRGVPQREDVFLAVDETVWIGKSDKWDAFSHVVKAKGTILIIMIRWCPLPWALGNGLFASIESVSFSSFMLANLLLQPRLLVPVFIGSRLVSLVNDDTEDGVPVDNVAKWINMISIILGLGISLGTGWFIYRATLQQMRELGYDGAVPASEAEEARDFLEQNALLGDYSGDEEEDEGAEGGVVGERTQLRGFRVGGDLERRVEEGAGDVTRGFTKNGKTGGFRSGRI